MAAAVATMRPLPRPPSGPLHTCAAEQRRSSSRLAPSESPTTASAKSPDSKAEEDSAPTLAQQPPQTQQQHSTPQPPTQQQAQEAEAQCTYNAERVVGNGTFGIVYSAHIVETDETVAIKKVFVDRRYRNRELQVWKDMQHPNIVTLKHAFYTSGDSPDELYLNMVMEFMPETVYCVMKRFTREKQTLPPGLVQLYTYQASRALAHLHASGVVHRDIKPQNMLVDASRGHLLKLCDFGSAAQLSRGKATLVAYICSRYYRAPELIFGAMNYTSAVDLWSIGCVLGEMLRGRPIFPGENGVDQLVEIVKVLGAPTRRQVVAMNPQYLKFAFPKIPPSSWRTIFRSSVDPEAIALLSAFLQYDPEARIRPLEACAHRCFEDLRDERFRCPDGRAPPPDLFSLTSRERRACAPGLRERLVPPWAASASGPSLSVVAGDAEDASRAGKA